MKNRWKMEKIGKVCVVIAGQSPEGKFYNNKGDGLPFYQGKKEFTKKILGPPTTWTSKITKIALPGDILMSVRAPVGPTNFNNEKICIGRGLAAIRTRAEINKDFLFYFFQLFEDEIVKNKGAVFDAINKTQIENIEIPLPPLSEQQRIVKILDDVFEKIAKVKENAEKNLQNAKELFESNLKSIFATKRNWEKRKIEECFKLKSGDGLTSKMMSANGIYPVFGGNGIAGSHNTFNLSGDNVIIGRVGALCGNVRHILENIWLTDNAFKIIDYKFNFDHSFLTYLLNFKNLRSFARQAAQPVISNSSLKNVIITFPKSLSEQQSIVSHLDTLSAETKKLEAIYKQKMADLEELKKSVLKKAFSGEL